MKNYICFDWLWYHEQQSLIFQIRDYMHGSYATHALLHMVSNGRWGGRGKRPVEILDANQLKIKEVWIEKKQWNLQGGTFRMTQVFVLYAVAWQRTALTTVTVLLQLQWHSDPVRRWTRTKQQHTNIFHESATVPRRWWWRTIYSVQTCTLSTGLPRSSCVFAGWTCCLFLYAAVRLVQGVNSPSHLPAATPSAAEADMMKWNFIRDTFVIIIPRPQLEL